MNVGQREGPAGGRTGVTQVGAPEVGEILADRYRIEEHINDDATGRQVWRGVDVILRRPVTILLRSPGGKEAEEMLSAAVAASRVIHPNIVGVYDAIDEGHRAYVVREWVDGRPLRDVVSREGPMEAHRAAAIAHAVAEALSAVHASGFTHGNVHPGTVLLSGDDRVVLGDARISPDATPETDVRAVGAVLYCALTGYWPREFPGAGVLPDAPRVEGGRIASPRQVRGGVPPFLDELTSDLLNPAVQPLTSAELAGELAQFSVPEEPALSGPLDFVTSTSIAVDSAPARPGARRFLFAIVALLVVALAGLVVATTFLPSGDNAAGGGVTPAPTISSFDPAQQAQPITISPNQVRLVDPVVDPDDEEDDIENVVDGDQTTSWPTNTYVSPDFGGLKDGMGVLIDLGAPYLITSVEVIFAQPGVTVGLRYGSEDPGRNADPQIAEEWEVAAPPVRAGGFIQLTPTEELTTQYLLVWMTDELPSYQDGYRAEIQEITVNGVPAS